MIRVLVLLNKLMGLTCNIKTQPVAHYFAPVKEKW